MDAFTVAEDLSTYDAEGLAQAIADGNAALDELFALDNPTEEQVADAERIADAVQSLEAERDSRVTATADRSARMAALKDRRTDPEPDDEVVEDEPVEASEDDDTEEIPVVVATDKPVKKAAAAIIRRRPEVPETKKAGLTLTAAADVPGFATGSQYADLGTLADAVVSRCRGFAPPQGRPDGQMQQYGVAVLRKEFDPNLIIDRGDDELAVIDRAAKETNLPGGSLTAAGGWCAPSETLYDFCEGESTDGLIDLPEVQVRRGGIRFTEGPSFADLYTDTGFTQTEAQAIAGATKPCYDIECPTFTEVRLDVVGLCIRVPILTNAAYPELIKRIVSGSLIAQQHRVSAAIIAKMVTAAGTAVTPTAIGGSISDSLAALELQAENLRATYRLPLASTMEVVLPWWVRSAIRVDLANRTGVDMLAVSDAQITSYFSSRKLNVQWVYDWQILDPTDEGYPATVDALIYPAGTFIKGVSDVITLNAVYDAASLATNTYTGLFTEEGILVVKRCYQAKLVTIPLCGAGRTGQANITACYSAA